MVTPAATATWERVVHVHVSQRGVETDANSKYVPVQTAQDTARLQPPIGPTACALAMQRGWGPSATSRNATPPTVACVGQPREVDQIAHARASRALPGTSARLSFARMRMTAATMAMPQVDDPAANALAIKVMLVKRVRPSPAPM